MGLILLLELVYKTWGILEYAIFGLKPPNVHTRDLVLFGLVNSSYIVAKYEPFSLFYLQGQTNVNMDSSYSS